jgi:hypothetical protein
MSIIIIKSLALSHSSSSKAASAGSGSSSSIIPINSSCCNNKLLPFFFFDYCLCDDHFLPLPQYGCCLQAALSSSPPLWAWSSLSFLILNPALKSNLCSFKPTNSKRKSHGAQQQQWDLEQCFKKAKPWSSLSIVKKEGAVLQCFFASLPQKLLENCNASPD